MAHRFASKRFPALLILVAGLAAATQAAIWTDDPATPDTAKAPEPKAPEPTPGSKPETKPDTKVDAKAKAPITNVELERIFSLKELVIPVATIDPSGDDFGDLEPILSKIGTARIVLLGEPSHGDGAAFMAKSRLVKFLHQRAGFDVLAFESGMYDCKRVNDGFREEAKWSDAAKRGIFGIWSQSEQCRNLFEYVMDTHTGAFAKDKPGLTPLTIAGFDSQFTAPLRDSPFFEELEEFFLRANGVITGDQADRLTQLKVWHIESKFQKLEYDEEQLSDEDREVLVKARAANREQTKELLENIADVIAAMDADLKQPTSRLLTHHSAQSVAFVRQSLLSLAAYTRQVDRAGTKDQGAQSESAGENKSETKPEDNNLRDKAMAENLIFLANTMYPRRKIIVWAASFHNAWAIEGIQWQDVPNAYASTKTMGGFVKEALGSDVYSIMFTAAQGETGRPWTGASPIEPAPKGSLEYLCKKANFQHVFIDLRGINPDDHPNAQWLTQPVVARPLGYAPMTAVWTEHADAFFFSQTMLPSTKAEVGDEPAKKKMKQSDDEDPGAPGEKKKPKF